MTALDSDDRVQLEYSRITGLYTMHDPDCYNLIPGEGGMDSTWQNMIVSAGAARLVAAYPCRDCYPEAHDQ